MRNRHFGRLTFVLFGGLAGLSAVSWALGQAPPPQKMPVNLPAIDVPAPSSQPSASAIRPANGTVPLQPKIAAMPGKTNAPAPFDRFRNIDSLPELTRQAVMPALAGMRWLNRYNQENGLFLHGYLPAVNQPMEGDHFLHQAMATFVLARAARFLGDEQFTVHANQSVLTLLSGTAVDPANPKARRPAQPSIVCNRLAAAGFLVLAINELPDPAADLLAKSEEICVFIALQQREDGSLSYVDNPEENSLSIDPDGVNLYPGPALDALALSQKARPAEWKAVALRKAIGFYRKWFKDHPHADMVPYMTAACTEAYAVTKENGFVEFAFEMNDWLCGQQYTESPDPRRPYWRGGFKSAGRARAETPAPGIEAALYAQSLADSCRLIRLMAHPDLKRYDQYRLSAIRALQFLTTLQFTESNTLHIAPNYRHLLVGGFHPSHADGNLRIDQSACATSAFIQFLVSGADRVQ